MRSGWPTTPEARPDVFFTGHDGSLRSNRVLAQLAGQYGIDLFIGSTLQLDAEGTPRRSPEGVSPASAERPTWGAMRGRRHSSAAWLDMIPRQSATGRGRKLVVQAVETFHKGGTPTIVETLDAVAVGEKAKMPTAPIMIYGDDVTHIVTEEELPTCTRRRAWMNAGRPSRPSQAPRRLA